jgi:hypothetical protein
MPDARRSFPRRMGIRSNVKQVLTRTLGMPSGSTTQETMVRNNAPSRPLRESSSYSSRGRDAVMD